MTDPKRRSGIRTDDDQPGSVSADPERSVLREAFSFWATGVCVVTVKDDTGVHGLTVSAFTPLSFDPPLVLICVGNEAPILTHLLDAGRFTVNILAAHQKRAANTFSDRFAVVLPLFREGDDAVIEDCLASVVCVVDRNLDGGDHRLITGRVTAASSMVDGQPLLHWRRSYRTFD
jgi:flavin reductase (DIM6/NTAB) family NADH-FMN oxidoreductase RutF